MIVNPETAKTVALHLLKINAIKLSPEKPFTWASGLHSPIYCDNRIALSYPAIRDFIWQELVKAVKEILAMPILWWGLQPPAFRKEYW